MPSISSCRARLGLELLEQRCLLSNYALGDIVPVSRDDPFADSTADDPQHQVGTLYPATSLETFLVVDPTDQDHLAALWQQDRWSNGGARGLELGISYDGGQTWLNEPLPGVGLCSGGTTARGSDPWLAFASNGDLYAAALAMTNGGGYAGIVVVKSTDGGFTWQDPVMIPGSGGADKESIITDPSDPYTAYVVWTGAYSRTTDGGQTFSRAQGLPTGSGSQIVVLPDGTLVDSYGGAVILSTDQGQTWGSPIALPGRSPRQVIDPNTRQPMRAGLGLGDIAVDPNNGTLYAVIEDGIPSGGQHDCISLTQSTDDGFDWSRPVQVNQTPTDIPTLDQQAFLPIVQVAADGTVGVSYYDFRNNQGGPDLPTDYWFVPGTPDGFGNITWGDELRLTDQSFNFEDAPVALYGRMIGDYQGRASAGNDLLNVFSHPEGDSRDAVFFRRVINLGDGPGGSHGPHGGPGPGSGGDLESTPGDVAALLRVDLVGVAFPVVLGPERAIQQSLPVAVPAGLDLGLASPEPFATRFSRASVRLEQATGSSGDVTLLAGLFRDEIAVAVAKGTASTPEGKGGCW